jgi:hypothetical protein
MAKKKNGTVTHRAKVVKELAALRAANRMSPEEVERFARNPKVALHKEFEWNNTRAGYLYRLRQARDIIRVSVIMLPSAVNPRQIVSVSENVSLPDHRGRGYEKIEVVLADEDRRDQLLTYTIKRLQSITEVNILPELKAVAKAIQEAATKYLEAEGEAGKTGRVLSRKITPQSRQVTAG